MIPWFIATEPFSPIDGERWSKYIEWSGLTQLSELITLDSMLCPPILAKVRDDYWPHIVNEDYMLGYFLDLEFLKREVAAIEKLNLLCVVRNPPSHLEHSPVDDFEFVGYDLVEGQTGVSALTNCGGFPDVFANAELSGRGLLMGFERATEVREKLRFLHREEHHSDCDLWAIFRATSK